MDIANYVKGSSLFTIDDILEDISDWRHYIVERILPECIVWEQYEQRHQPLPSIREVFLATEWNGKEGATRLPKKISQGCTLQHLLQFFTGRPKCLWVIIATEEPEISEDIPDTSNVKIKSEKITKPLLKRRPAIKMQTVQSDATTVSVRSPAVRPCTD